MLRKITKHVWTHESECLQSNSVIIEGNNKGVLLIDPGLTSDELLSIAEDLSKMGLVVAAGFSTHPHWDHVLWHSAFGNVPRYATYAAAEQMEKTLSNVNWKEEEAAGLPEEIAGQVPLDDLYGRLTALPVGTQFIPWDGQKVRIVEHSGHAPGHAALYAEEDKVLVAGDMLSDVFVPMLNLAAKDPLNDYLKALTDLEKVAQDAEFVVPGHGSIGDFDQLTNRLHQDREYIERLLDGRRVDDSRITSPKKGWEWVADIHNWQANQLGQKHQ